MTHRRWHSSDVDEEGCIRDKGSRREAIAGWYTIDGPPTLYPQSLFPTRLTAYDEYQLSALSRYLQQVTAPSK